MRKAMLWQARHIAALKEHAARRRSESAAQQIEIRALAGAVRPDDRRDGAAPEIDADVAQGGEAAEHLADGFRPEDDLRIDAHFFSIPCRIEPQIPRGKNSTQT